MKTITKQTIRVGNSAGVLLPKDWLNSEVTVTLKKEPLNIKKDVLKLLMPHLNDVVGIYIVGSHARGEEDSDSDVDILIITDNPIKLPKFKDYHLILSTPETIRRALKENPILIYPMIREAKPILNSYLLQEFQRYKINSKKFKWFIETTKSSLKMNKELLDIEEEFENNEVLDAISVIYSLILRLRGIWIIESILKNKFYSNKDLMKFGNKKLGKDVFEEMYKVYRAERDKKTMPKHKITLENAKKLYELVDGLIKKLEKKI